MISKAILVAVLSFIATHAMAAGNADTGQQLAEKWCSSCHNTGAATSMTDAAPSFPSLAHQARTNPTWTKAWLTAPHPPMEGIQLSRREIDDIVAYLQSLPSK